MKKNSIKERAKRNSKMVKIKVAIIAWWLKLRQYFVTRSKGNGCKCTFCKIHPYEKWATVMECQCVCHTSDGMTGHDGLCCSLPNVLKKNNPYKKLEKAEFYRKQINDYFGDEM